MTTATDGTSTPRARTLVVINTRLSESRNRCMTESRSGPLMSEWRQETSYPPRFIISDTESAAPRCSTNTMLCCILSLEYSSFKTAILPPTQGEKESGVSNKAHKNINAHTLCSLTCWANIQCDFEYFLHHQFFVRRKFECHSTWHPRSGTVEHFSAVCCTKEHNLAGGWKLTTDKQCFRAQWAGSLSLLHHEISFIENKYSHILKWHILFTDTLYCFARSPNHYMGTCNRLQQQQQHQQQQQIKHRWASAEACQHRNNQNSNSKQSKAK